MEVPAGKAGHFDLYTNKTHLSYAKMHRPFLDRCHLSMNALTILEILDQNPECRTPKDLIAILGLKSNVVYLHVDHLVEEGYLERHTAENDRRKITLSCTRKAKTLLKKAMEIRKQYFETMTAGVDPEDYAVYQRVVRKIEENIDAFLGET